LIEERRTYTGTDVFRFGLKNSSGTTVAVVFIRCASMFDQAAFLH
jgi:hypothetical protein